MTFVDVTLWGRQAEVAGEYLSKGRQVLVEGRLQLDSWEDKESGQKRSKLRVVCENMTMVGRGDGPRGDGPRSEGRGEADREGPNPAAGWRQPPAARKSEASPGGSGSPGQRSFLGPTE